jgi:hypothetical protein
MILRMAQLTTMLGLYAFARHHDVYFGPPPSSSSPRGSTLDQKDGGPGSRVHGRAGVHRHRTVHKGMVRGA